MNILIVHPYEIRCGPHHVTVGLAKALVSAGHRVAVVVPQQNKVASDFREAGATTCVISSLSSYRRSASIFEEVKNALRSCMGVAGIWRVVHAHKVNIVHTSTVACPAGLIAARLAGCASVAHLHDVSIWRPRPLGIIYGLFLSATCDLIIAVSEAAKRAVVPSILRRKTEVVYNSVDIDGFKPDCEARTQGRADLLASPSEFLIGCVGNLDHRKGQDLLADVAAHLLTRGEQFRFVIVGEVSPAAKKTAFMTQFQQRISALKVQKHFTFVGHRTDINRLMNAFDVLIQPSRMDAGPLVLIEALACEVPVVATDVDANPEEVKDGTTGLTVPPENAAAMAAALQELRNDPERRNQMGKAGRCDVKDRFDHRDQLNRVTALYSRVLQQRKKNTVSLQKIFNNTSRKAV